MLATQVVLFWNSSKRLKLKVMKVDASDRFSFAKNGVIFRCKIYSKLKKTSQLTRGIWMDLLVEPEAVHFGSGWKPRSFFSLDPNVEIPELERTIASSRSLIQPLTHHCSTRSSDGHSECTGSLTFHESYWLFKNGILIMDDYYPCKTG